MNREVTPGAAEAVKEVLERILTMPIDQRIDFLEMLVTAGLNFMRAGSGEEYVRGYLDAARASLEEPSFITIRDLGKN